MIIFVLSSLEMRNSMQTISELFWFPIKIKQLVDAIILVPIDHNGAFTNYKTVCCSM